LFPILILSLLQLRAPDAWSLPMSPGAPKLDRFPRSDEPGQRTGAEAAALPGKRRIFGVGVGFDKSGTLSGVAVQIVLPGSPAARAGIVVGSVVVEINGTAAAGRTGEDCATLIRDSVGLVRLRILDPTLKEKELILTKEWLAVPE
jgi:hypothetical protein